MAEVPVLCAAVRLGSDTGQRDQSYANGSLRWITGGGEEEEKHVFSCVHLGPLFFFLPFQIEKGITLSVVPM